VPVRSKERLETDYKQAVGLLRSDLVWSKDFDSIRMDLADLIQFYASAAYFPSALTNIVQNIIAEENDLSI